MEFTTTIDTPVGELLLVSDGIALTAILFDRPRGSSGRTGAGVAPFPQARRQLAEYFAGRRRDFQIPLAPVGTPFQRRVWDALRRIPHGSTATYQEIARAVGSPRAARAVGAANACNPLAIVVPCHRVIRSDGALGGYAGGTGRKAALLNLEAARRTPGSSGGARR